jgi:chemotaxis family two-component system sensor kinase Cph1
VPSSEASGPGFGQADLSNCELEQIHLAGSIQPHGALLLVREPELVIVQASANAGDLLRVPDRLLGRTLAELGGDLCKLVRAHLGDSLERIPVAVRCRVGPSQAELDGFIHRPPGGGLVIELEPSSPSVDLAEIVCDGLRTVSATASLKALCDETAKIFKDIAGYDRVMVYRFDDQGHGQVYSERREPHLEPYLGMWYPSSDIPQMARRLYSDNRVRLLRDIDYTPVPLTPSLSPITGADPDMSLCYLRSMSPIHIQYLKNMGVSATLVASLLVGGKLWGLIACHHYSPHFVPYQVRVVCELLAEAVSTRIAALQSFAQSQAELSVRRLEQRMIEAIARDGDWEGALFDNPQFLLQPLDAAGAALLSDGRVRTTGDVPGTQQLREIVAWLDRQPETAIFATSSLGAREASFEPLKSVAAGLLAARTSSDPDEYLIWFRPERVRTLTWGGNPYKAVEIGNDPTHLSPRRSFAQWHQLVEGTSDPWTAEDMTTARLIGESVADVIQQFRSVRFLIAQDHLEQIRQKVHTSAQPVVVADAAGRILLTNDAFDGLLTTGTRPRSLHDLLPLFVAPAEAEHHFAELRAQRRPWRGEVLLSTANAGTKPYLIRADPVLSSPRQVLGFVMLLTDIAERKEAEEARRRFQDGIRHQHKMLAVPLDSKADLMFRDLMASIIGNAQLAALEITDSLDVSQVADMLDSVQVSVSRMTELLEHLMWYSARDPRQDS